MGVTRRALTAPLERMLQGPILLWSVLPGLFLGIALILAGCGWGAGDDGAEELGQATEAAGRTDGAPAESPAGVGTADTGAFDSDAAAETDTDGDENGAGAREQSPGGDAAVEPLPPLALERVADGLTAPVDVAVVGETLIVADQAGFLWRIDGANPESDPEQALDLRDRMVGIRPGYDERGLLGIATHPDVESNGRLFVYYSAPGTDLPAGWDHTGVLSEFRLTDAGVDPNSERRLLEVEQPQSNHNGGAVDFGPEGALYLGLGDGGNANDEGLGHPSGGNGQDAHTLLGTILRLNVDEPGAVSPWPDNPFDGDAGAPEIFAFGFRNPFRLSFDPETGALWTGDVGQNRWEEVNQVVAGGNYGWPIREGPDCFSQDQPNAPPDTCPEDGANGRALRDPVLSYRNAALPEGRGLAVIGGGVYRGDAVPALRGRYVFGDWSTSFSQADGHLFVATRSEGGWSFEAAPLADGLSGSLGRYLLGIGRDGAGEMLVMTSANGGPSGTTGRVDRLVVASEP